METLNSEHKGKNGSAPAKEKPTKGNRLPAHLVLLHFTILCFTDVASFKKNGRQDVPPAKRLRLILL